MGYVVYTPRNLPQLLPAPSFLQLSNYFYDRGCCLSRSPAPHSLRPHAQDMDDPDYPTSQASSVPLRKRETRGQSPPRDGVLGNVAA